MNLSRIYLIAILLLTFGVGANGQAPPKAVLVDEFGKPDCEVLWAKLDGFIQQVQTDPTSIATIEISGKTDDSHGNFYWDNMIRGYFVRRNIPKERWSVRRAALGNERIVRFWLTPPGAIPPKIEVAEWDMAYPIDTKPFIFTNGESYSVEVGVCLYVDEIALLAKALEFNPAARVNVVLIVRSDREYLRRRQKTIKELVDGYSIRRSRIKIFKKLSSKPNPYGINPTTEYWLIP